MKAIHIRRLRRQITRFKTYKISALVFTYSADHIEIKAKSYKHAIQRFAKRKTSYLEQDNFHIKKAVRPKCGDLRIVGPSGNVKYFTTSDTFGDPIYEERGR